MRMYVAGEWVSKAQVIPVDNPYDRSVIDTVPRADRGDVERARESAAGGAKAMARLSPRLRQALCQPIQTGRSAARAGLRRPTNGIRTSDRPEMALSPEVSAGCTRRRPTTRVRARAKPQERAVTFPAPLCRRPRYHDHARQPWA